jgi:hypothetical protein
MIIGQGYDIMQRYEMLIEFYEVNHQIEERDKLIEQVMLTPFQDLREIIEYHEVNQIIGLRRIKANINK